MHRRTWWCQNMACRGSPVIPANRTLRHCSLSSGLLASTTTSSWAGASIEGMPPCSGGVQTNHKASPLDLGHHCEFQQSQNLKLEWMHERSALIFCASLASPIAQATRKTQCQNLAPLVRASRRVHRVHASSPCSFGTLSSFSFPPDSPLGFFDPSFSSRDANAILRDLRKNAYTLGPTPIPFIDHHQPPSSEFNHCICCTCKLSLS